MCIHLFIMLLNNKYWKCTAAFSSHNKYISNVLEQGIANSDAPVELLSGHRFYLAAARRENE